MRLFFDWEKGGRKEVEETKLKFFSSIVLVGALGMLCIQYFGNFYVWICALILLVLGVFAIIRGSVCAKSTLLAGLLIMEYIAVINTTTALAFLFLIPDVFLAWFLFFRA